MPVLVALKNYAHLEIRHESSDKIATKSVWQRLMFMVRFIAFGGISYSFRMTLTHFCIPFSSLQMRGGLQLVLLGIIVK